MYKYLVVGCGGSGGATLAYLMDQIKSELIAHGIDAIPAGMQFVHIDVPTAPDTSEPGLENVRAQGGTYIGTAPRTGSYSTLDGSMATRLRERDGLQHIATWAPRDPAKVLVPIALGAGQMRAVGRMLTLSHMKSLAQQLAQAADALNTIEANSQMSLTASALPGAGAFDQAAPIVTIVVSSMAGGAGASMALDVCRLLSQLPQIDPNLIAVFMMAPDVFGQLEESRRGGVLGNSLAMLGEIVAAQTGAAASHDKGLLSALGLNIDATSAAPFKRVFPVGRFSGTDRTQFGNGSQSAVYRGLGRGLAALMLSGRASTDFVSYDLTNAGLALKQEVFGWGTSSDLAWGSFGFGSLSLGRDRYRHYAAQRLARTAVDRLVRGHLQPGSVRSASEQLRSLLDAQWPSIAAAAGLPRQATAGVVTRDELGEWMTSVALPRVAVNSDVQQIVDSAVRPNLPIPGGTVAPWLATVRGALSAQRAGLHERTDRDAYRWAYDWAQRLHDQVLGEVASAVERFGLPFGRAVVERMESVVADQLVPQLLDRAKHDTPDVGSVPNAFDSEAGRIRGNVSNAGELLDRLLTQLSDALLRLRYGRSSQLAADVMRSFVGEVLAPLSRSLSDALEVLEVATAPSAEMSSGLANVETDRYAAWPSDDDAQVASRFGVADNEVLLTPFEGFGDSYRVQLPPAVGSGPSGMMTFDEARVGAARMVVAGRWPVSGGAIAPGGLVETVARWRAGMFVLEPESGQPLQPSLGRYQWHVTTAELLERALAFVARPGESFDRYCSQSLASYVAAADATPAAADARRRDLVDKFGQAVVRALPLISVDAEAVQALHDAPLEYFFKFSAIPFADAPALAAALEDRLRAMPNVSALITQSDGVYSRALVASAESSVNRIDIFGSYRTYSPIVFDALLKPVSDTWAGTQDFNRRAFWQLRRARPLAASLPMSDAERRAMVAGWYVGLLTGRITIPEEPFTQPVRVFDAAEQRWLDFPWPLLTPPSQFVGKSFDWLPAVLESVLLAISRSLEQPVLSSMRPYQVLRSFWDDTPDEPATGLLSLASQRELAAWLATGETGSGRPGRVPGGTLEERYENAKAWLSAIRDWAGAKFMPPGLDGAPGGEDFSIIDSRAKASATPVFRDLAEDIWLQFAKLLEVLDAARTQPVAWTSTVKPGPSFGPI